MNRIMRHVGLMSFWLGWPYFFFYLRNTERTRVLVTTADQILLVRSWLGSGDWDLPGGGIDDGETPAEGAARELQEEVGLIIDPVDLRLLQQHPVTMRGLPFMCHFFQLQLAVAVPAVLHEHEIADAVWVPVADMPKYTVASYSRPIVEGWLAATNLVE